MYTSFERHCVILQNRMINEYERRVVSYARQAANERDAQRAAIFTAKCESARAILNCLIMAKNAGIIDWHTASEAIRVYSFSPEPSAPAQPIVNEPESAQLTLF